MKAVVVKNIYCRYVQKNDCWTVDEVFLSCPSKLDFDFRRSEFPEVNAANMWAQAYLPPGTEITYVFFGCRDIGLKTQRLHLKLCFVFTPSACQYIEAGWFSFNGQ